VLTRASSALALAAAAVLLAASPALADQATYTVTGLTDSGTCTGTQPNFTCTSLRAAVQDANADSAADMIFLQEPGTYAVPTALVLSGDVSIQGLDARTTALQGNGTDRVLEVRPGVSATIVGITVEDGDSFTGRGGNILNSGTLDIFQSDVRRGYAETGGGIANVAPGQLTVSFSAIHDNESADDGGGIANVGIGGTQPAGADLTVVDSTIAMNNGTTGGGIGSDGALNTVTLHQVTIAWNGGGGLGITGGGQVSLYGSILTANSGGNCSAVTPTDEGYNLDSANTCALTGTGSLHGVDPQLSDAFENAGGFTDVLTFPATSPAVDLVATCFIGIDQRGFQRVTDLSQPCDAGAYEQSATGPAATAITAGPSGVTTERSPSFTFSSSDPQTHFECRLSGPGSEPGTFAPCTSPKTYSNLAPGTYVFTVQPVGSDGNPTEAPLSRAFTVAPPTQPAPSPTPTATPAPTAAPTPTPSFHQSVVVRPVSGRVLVRRPGGKDFVEVDATQGIPLGSTVDTTHGVIELTSVPKKNGTPEKAQFFDGIFKVTQSGSSTDLTLNEPLAACGNARAAAKKPKTRKLWGDGSGSFRTRGQYSAATVRGTKWLVQDSCAGTLTKVAKGVVSVRDNVKRRTILLKAGKQYLAKPKH
jgi:hypothetical protein